MNRLLHPTAWLTVGATLVLSIVAYMQVDQMETADVLGQFDRLADLDARQIEI